MAEGHSIAMHGVPGTPVSGEFVRNTAALATAEKQPKDNCQSCGRFVYGADCGLVWDDYCGGWEADPMCKRCRFGDES